MVKQQEATSWPEGKAPGTVDELYRCLEASRVLSADESQGVVESLEAGKRPDSPKEIAIELVKAGKLTKYQAQAVLQGKIRYLRFDDYIVLEKLGRGGMGQVLKAEHRRMQRTVALKVIVRRAVHDAQAVKRFQREVHAAARLIHTNIVTAFDANEHEGVHFMVMEYVDGRTLAELLQEEGPLPVAKAVDYVVQAARGLAYAHGKGVIHRDIKPSNLLVDGDGTVKILDMGLARVDGGAGQRLSLTINGQVMGTADYMAPEQAEDTHSVDARADIYSLGSTLYRLISGAVMYEDESVVKKLLLHGSAPIPSLIKAAEHSGRRGTCTPMLESVYQKMVAKRPEDRQQTMGEVVSDLEACLREMTATASPAAGAKVSPDPKPSESSQNPSPRDENPSLTGGESETESMSVTLTESMDVLSHGDPDTVLGSGADEADSGVLSYGDSAVGKRNRRYIWIAAALIGFLAIVAAIAGLWAVGVI